MMQNLFYLLLLSSSAFALVIQEPGKTPENEESSRTDSTLFPLILNPWQVSHWNCFGTTLYENTAVSGDYTYNVDVCFTAVIAAKLLFPWFYQAHTGNNLLVDLGILEPSAEAEDGYGAPAEQYSAPAVEEYGAPVYQAEETYGAPKPTYGAFEPKPTYGAFEQRRNGKTPSFQERLSIAFKDLSRAITKNNPLSSYQ
jgi:hypothetical protein